MEQYRPVPVIELVQVQVAPKWLLCPQGKGTTHNLRIPRDKGTNPEVENHLQDVAEVTAEQRFRSDWVAHLSQEGAATATSSQWPPVS